jgi:RHS repeat-associated protein
MRREQWVSAACALIIPCVWSSLCLGAAGRTAGTFAVSPTGAATYTIPLWTPPGPHGLQPHLALVYNSQGSNSYLGVGWSLAGLSSIYRCNKTYAQDGAPGAVALATSDGYCMDGQRLRLTGGTYGADGSTYQTEIANFANVTAHGSAGNGPAYFVVQMKSGLIYEYGNGGNSQVLASGTSTAAQWLMDKVSDRAGNTLTVSYEPPSSENQGETVPATISWTPSSYGASTYNYSVNFQYTTLSVAPTAGYLAGTPAVNYYLMTAIVIDSGSNTVKNYELGYTASPTTERETLTSVTECADAAGTNCLAPTTVGYQAGAAGVASTATTLTSSTSLYSVIQADFNGDGHTDLAWYSGSTWLVSFATSTGFSAPVNTGVTFSQALVDTVDGTLTAGFLVQQSGYWYYYKWNGSSFSGVSTGTPVDATWYVSFAIADLNGDGLPDLVTTSTTNNDLLVRLNTTSGGTVSFGAPIDTGQQNTYNNINASTIPGRPRPSFTDNGRQDVYARECYPAGGSSYCFSYALQYNGASFVSSAALYSGIGVALSYSSDFNDDGCADVLFQNELDIAACNGQAASIISMPSGITAEGFIDWDGDGRQDLLVTDGAYLYVYRSQATGFSSAISTGIPLTAGRGYVAIHNATGDGEDALVSYSAGSGATVQYYLHNGAGQPPDLMTSVTDGYGNYIEPAYASIAQSNYALNLDGAYPDQDYIGSMYVVSQATFSDPSDQPSGSYSQQFEYYGAWKNLQGRGFDGFYSVHTYDSRNGLYHYQYHERAFPYSGMKYQDIVSTGPLDLIQTVGTPAVMTLDGTAYNQRYFVYFSNSMAYRREVGGSESGDLIATRSTDYSYDSYGNITSSSSTVYDNDPGSPYNGASWTTSVSNDPDVDSGNQAADLTAWCLGLNDSTVVTYSSSLSGSAPVTRTTDFTPDGNASNCRVVTKVTEPASSAYKVTESYGFDSFGNINSDIVTGVNMSARTTTAGWGATGQLPVWVTDPASQTVHFDYDYDFGLVSSVTDPNGLTTSWQYDGYGRKTQENRPDGTYTAWIYNDCVNWGGCLIGSHALDITHNIYNADGSISNNGTTYFDPAGRFLLSNRRLMDGSYKRDEVRYDSLGRIVEHAAPCIWSSVTASCPYWTAYSYDVMNRLTQMQRPINQNNSTLQTTDYGYEGNTRTITDPNGHTKTTVSDPNGWLRQTKDTYGYTVSMAYDAAGSRTSVTDSLGHTLWSGSWVYGIAPFNTHAADADLGTWDYTYDALGERIGWTDAKIQSFGESYDSLGRPVARTEPDYFTQWTWGSTPSSHNVGKLASICTGTGSSPTACTASGYSETETYDSDGRLAQRSILIPNNGTFTYSWQYNATTGLLDTLTYPTSTQGYALQLRYGYSSGILSSVTNISDSPNVTVWQANATDPAGQITQETLGNGVVTNRTYDAVTGWLSQMTAGVGSGSALENQSYLYGLTGAVSQRQDNNLGLTENFNYDDDYRLTSSTLNSTQNLGVSYDQMGNISSRSDIAGGAAWTYDATRIHAVTQAGSSSYTYTYDANGNASTRNGSTINWTAYNYPSSITAGSESVQFAYGPDRLRWQQNYNSGAEITDYIGGLMEEVFSGGTTTYRHYVYAGKEPVAVYSRTSTLQNTWNYFLTDHQGSVSAITNSSGATVVNESFTAFGARRDPTTWSGAPSSSDLNTIAGISRQGYTFQTALGLSMGLNHMNGRVQDAITGRFLSADPNVPDPSDPQGYNRYSYVTNNPLTYTDPTGFFCNDPTFYGDPGQGCLDFITVTAPYSCLPPGCFDFGQLPDALGYGTGGTNSCPPAVCTDLGSADPTSLLPNTYMPSAGSGGGAVSASPPPDKSPPALTGKITGPPTQTNQSSWKTALCKTLAGVSGAVSGAVAGGTLTLQTGQFEAAPALVIGGVLSGAALGAFAPAGGWAGAIIGAVGARFSPGSSGTDIAGGAVNGAIGPGAMTIPAAGVTGGISGGVAGLLGSGIEGLGIAGNAIVGASGAAGAAAAGLATNGVLNSWFNHLSGCSN